MNRCSSIYDLIRTGQIHEDLIPLNRIPDLLPSSRSGKRVARTTIIRWFLKGLLKGRKIGGSWFVTAHDLAQFVDSKSKEHPLSMAEASAARLSAQRAGAELDRLLGKAG